MKITAKQYAQSLYEATADVKQAEAKKIITKWLQLMIDNQDLNKLEASLQAFSQLWQTESGMVKAEVISKHKLEPAVLKTLTDQIKQLTKAKQVDWTEKQDNSMLGGVIVKYQDQILDGSLNTMINNLKQAIVK